MVEGDLDKAGEFKVIGDDVELTIQQDDDPPGEGEDWDTHPVTKLVRDWIQYQRTMNADGFVSRMLCSTET